MKNRLTRASRSGAPLIKGFGRILARGGLMGALIALFGAMGQESGHLLLIPAFGSSAIIVFAASTSPMASVRAVVGGNLLAAAVGCGVVALIGPGWEAAALGVALAFILMEATGTSHVPAGGHPVYAALIHPHWDLLLFPIVPAVLCLALAAVLMRRFDRRSHRHLEGNAS